MATVEEIQKEAAELNEKFQKSQEAMTTLESSIQQLNVTISENTTVKKELESMKEGQKVYKLVGPVLIRVDISEAMSNVDNRLKLLQRQSEEMAEKAKKENEHYKEIEDEFIKLQQKAAMLKVENMPKQS
ncbi:hypothetical protein JH06_1750 [Blastocystis sp. subtype 4]|uniref:hypothetical protein n=1 Tax=Blastocystis sp. subtype 4 TaxID=944170 RepID=UPI000711B06F|nr:hypothetical protein JH06_1750 [Blastocystis sp. subtype 4]KNB45128.1 hypothetical protein JH06_1750 [Blastocystis sp. subtype 4]|eukprot:XP_014528566.1 hypothetical protein JH06_1750 [Blastocystis sp. subtype 4]